MAITEAELDAKIADAMACLKTDDVKNAAKKAYSDYEHELKEQIAKKEGVSDWSKVKKSKREGLLDKYSDRWPMENYLYLMFSDEGDFEGWTIEHSQYFRGHSGPTSAISIGPEGVDYKDVEREINNDLGEAIETEG